MKRLIAFVLCMVMCIGLLACGKPNVDTTTDPKTPDDTTAQKELAVDHFKGTKLTVAYAKKPTDTCVDFNTKEIFKLATEATGIEIEWVIVDSGVAKEKLATLLMSDNPPDIFIGFGNDESTFLNNPDAFYDLSEEGLLETYAPNVVRDYDLAPEAWLSITYGDGSIRGLVTGELKADGAKGMSSTWAINEEWLKKANLPVPTTADELYTALKYFKEHDMDGDGDPNNEIPMSFCNGYSQADVMMMAGPFGIAGNYTWQAKDHYKNIKDGKVVSTVDTENYRAFLEFFHKLYSEGLLDVEGFSQTTDQYTAKRSSGICGVIGTNTAMLDKGYVNFLYEGMEGVTPMLSGYQYRFQGQRNSFAISAESKNVEAALWWWNWMSKDRETKLIAYGSSEFFTKDDAGNYYINPEFTASGVNVTTTGMQDWSPLRIPGDNAVSHPDAASQPAAKAREDFLDKYMSTEHVNLESFPIMYSSDPKADEERGYIETELFTYIASFTADAISNGVDDAKWQQHLNDLKSYQYYDWLDIYQDLVDEAAARVG